MVKGFRYFLMLVSVVQLFFSAAFIMQWPFAINLWPFPGTTPLTYLLVGSIFAAAGASTLWAVGSGNLGALAGIALDYLTIMTPLAIYGFLLPADTPDVQLATFRIACLGGALFGLALFLWSVRIPLDATRPMPPLVRWSFVVFVLALVFFGGRLILQTPNIIPWSITPQLSVLIGWMFLGAAVYFAYGVLRPSWTNAAGQLVGFLAYDIVLIVPFLRRLPTVAPEHRLGQIIYTVVVIYSGLLAIYYLFVNKRTRVTLDSPA